MGLNIHVTDKNGWSCTDWWDFDKHSGDVEFAIQNEFDIFPIDDIGIEYVKRPHDFKACFEWIENAEIPESNKERLKKMLTELFENGDMFLDFCW